MDGVVAVAEAVMLRVALTDFLGACGARCCGSSLVAAVDATTAGGRMPDPAHTSGNPLKVPVPASHSTCTTRCTFMGPDISGSPLGTAGRRAVIERDLMSATVAVFRVDVVVSNR